MNPNQKFIQTISEALEHVQLNEGLSSLGHLHGLLSSSTDPRSIGAISASRSHPEMTKQEETAHNNKETDNLETDLKKTGLAYRPVRGGYIENKDTPEEKDVTGEKSFIVIG